MYSIKYNFMTETGGEGIPVGAGDTYNEDRGCGFLDFAPLKERPQDRFTGSAGWQIREISGSQLPDEQRVTPRWGVDSAQEGWPLRFRAKVPEQGVYAVTVTICGGEQGIPQLAVYSGRRNTVQRDISILPGESYVYRFYVHVCEYIPVMGRPPVADNSVYVSVLGSTARLSGLTVEKSEAPTVFIAGDSIVADYEGYCPYNPIINGGSWGHNLLQYFDRAAVVNQAHGGMTTNCFRDDGHWDIVDRHIRPGDIFLFQFGHNDQKRRNLAAFTGYAANLRWYVRRVREKGAVPVIVTSLSRMPEQDEYGWFDLLEDHALACVRTGKELNVPVIDLHRYSFELFCSMDRDKLKGYFNDRAHTNDYGAMLVAEFVAGQIQKQRIEPMCSCMNGLFPKPWDPDESLRPAGQLSPAKKPEKPILPTDLPELPYADCRHIRQQDILKEAMAKGLLDPCLKFFHPFEEMPRGQFLYMFFKAVKATKQRPYQGRYCDIYRYEFDASAVQAALDAGLVDGATTMNDRFRPDDGLTGGELVSFMIRSLHEPEDREYDLAECEQQAKGLGMLWEGYGRHVKVNRADCVAALVHLMNVTEAEKSGLPKRY